MGDFLEKLKTRWGVKNNRAAALILLVFAITGSLSVKVIKVIEHWLGIDSSSGFGIKLVSFIVLVLPVYNLLLLLIGSLLGQHQFFKNFIVKFFRRLFFLRKK